MRKNVKSKIQIVRIGKKKIIKLKKDLQKRNTKSQKERDFRKEPKPTGENTQHKQVHGQQQEDKGQLVHILWANSFLWLGVAFTFIVNTSRK